MTTQPATPAPVELLLIRSDPPCARCRKTEELLHQILADRPTDVTLRIITTQDPAAARYGAVITPLLALNGKIACAGIVPRRGGVESLVDAELRRGP